MNKRSSTDASKRCPSDERGPICKRSINELPGCSECAEPMKWLLKKQIAKGYGIPIEVLVSGEELRRMEMAEPTHYYSLAGTLTRDGVPITDVDEISEFMVHWMKAAGRYHGENGFRFVDADGNATLSTGEVAINWSDYGLDSDARA